LTSKISKKLSKNERDTRDFPVTENSVGEVGLKETSAQRKFLALDDKERRSVLQKYQKKEPHLLATFITTARKSVWEGDKWMGKSDKPQPWNHRGGDLQ